MVDQGSLFAGPWIITLGHLYIVFYTITRNQKYPHFTILFNTKKVLCKRQNPHRCKLNIFEIIFKMHCDFGKFTISCTIA